LSEGSTTATQRCAAEDACRCYILIYWQVYWKGEITNTHTILEKLREDANDSDNEIMIVVFPKRCVDSSGLRKKLAVSYSKNGNELVTLVSHKSKVHFFPFAVQKRERTDAGYVRFNRREDEGQTQRRSEKHYNVERKMGSGAEWGGGGGRKTVTQSATGICLLDVVM
jgi:hypothetical protein